MVTTQTQWEVSAFGGYSRLIQDHPFVSIPMEMDIETPKCDLVMWQAQKVVKMFLYKVNEYKLTDKLLQNQTVVERTVWLKTKKFAQVNPASIENTYNALCTSADELLPLFNHYKDIILGAEIEMELPDEKNKGKGSGDGEEQSDEEPKEDGEETLSAETKDQLKKMLMKVSKQKPFTYSTSDSVSGELKDKTVFRNIEKDSRKINYSADETIAADNLVKVLDISFEPERDKIQNLKVGKLDIAKLAEVKSGNTNIYYTVEENQTTRPFSVCVLGDESGSMHWGWKEESRCYQQHKLMKVLYRAFSQILPQDKLYFYGHSDDGDINPEVRVYHDPYNPHFEETIGAQEHADYNENYDGPVIERIYERIRETTDDNIIFLCISDGEPSGRNYGGTQAVQDLKRIVERCKRDGFVTIGIGVQAEHVKDIYQYSSVVNDLNDLVKATSRVINSVVKQEFQ